MNPRGWPARIAARLPEPLLAAPERLLINLGILLIGVAGLVPPPGGPIDAWPDWLALEWSALMILSGICGLHGHWTGVRLTERVGALGMALGSLLYVVQVLDFAGLRGTVTAMIFTAMAFAGVLRWLRSSAVVAHLRARAEEEDGGQSWTQ